MSSCQVEKGVFFEKTKKFAVVQKNEGKTFSEKKSFHQIYLTSFHFMKITEDETLKAAAEKLLEYDTVYYTGHCTGEKPYRYLKSKLKERMEYIPAGRIIEF